MARRPPSRCYSPGITRSRDFNDPVSTDFVKSSSFQKVRPGYVFKLGDSGLGYYKDESEKFVASFLASCAVADDANAFAYITGAPWQSELAVSRLA